MIKVCTQLADFMFQLGSPEIKKKRTKIWICLELELHLVMVKGDSYLSLAQCIWFNRNFNHDNYRFFFLHLNIKCCSVEGVTLKVFYLQM